MIAKKPVFKTDFVRPTRPVDPETLFHNLRGRAQLDFVQNEEGISGHIASRIVGCVGYHQPTMLAVRSRNAPCQHTS